jgi:hypothetical protein
MDMERMIDIQEAICRLAEAILAQNRLIRDQQKALLIQSMALKEVASNLGELIDAQIEAMERLH